MGDLIDATDYFKTDEKEEDMKMHPLYLTYEPSRKDDADVQAFQTGLTGRNMIQTPMFEGDMTVVFADASGQLITYAFTAIPRAIVSGGRASDAEKLFMKRVGEALKDLNAGVREEAAG